MENSLHNHWESKSLPSSDQNASSKPVRIVSLQKRIAWKVSTAIISGKKNSPAPAHNWLDAISHLPYADTENLRNWYNNEWFQVIKNILASRNMKKAWLEYSLDFNLQRASESGFLLPSTIDTVIHAFGVRHINKLNFLGLLSGKITSEDVPSETDTEKWHKKYVASAEDLRDWYDNRGGENVVDECLNSDNYAQAWKEYAMNFNAGTCVDVWYSLPVTIHSLVHAFGVKKINKMTFFWFLSGTMTKEDFETRIQDSGKRLSSRHSATREVLQEWYRNGGKETVQNMLVSSDYRKAWKDYAKKFNKEQSLQEGYRLQETIWGVIRVFYPDETHHNKQLFLSCFTVDITKLPQKTGRIRKTVIRSKKKNTRPILVCVPKKTPQEIQKMQASNKSRKKTGKYSRESFDDAVKNQSLNPSQILFINNRFPSLLGIPRKYLGPFHMFIRKVEYFLDNQGEIKRKVISENDIALKIIPSGKIASGKIIIKDPELQEYVPDLERCLDETLEWWESSVNEKIRTNSTDPSVQLIIERHLP